MATDMTHPAPEAGWREILTGDFAGVSALLACGIALHAVNITITATMLPSITGEIGGQRLYAWNTTLATLAAILSAAVSGKLMRRTGARLGFALAGLVFSAGCLIAALAPSMVVMLAARAVQGAGGGMMFTLCYAMIVLIYPERLWSRALALLSGTWGITMLFGPAAGGVFAQLGIWRAGFGVMLPATALFVLLTFKLLPRTETRKAKPEPVAAGQLALLAGAVLAVSAGGLAASPLLAAAAVLAAGILILLVMRRENSGHLRLFPQGAMTPGSSLFLALAVMALLIFCVNAEFFMPLYLQRLHGLTPLASGYVAALVSAGWAASEVYAAKSTGRALHRAVLAGPLLTLASCLALGTATPLFEASGPLTAAAIGAALLALGAGIGTGWPHLNTFVLTYTRVEERDMAASALSTVQMFAVAFGTAVAGLVGNFSGLKEAQNQAALANSALWLFILFAGVSALAVLASRALIRSTGRG